MIGTATPDYRATRRTRTPHSSRHTMSSARVREALWAWVFIAPTAIGLLVFSLWPTIRTFYFSFTTWGPFGGSTFTGFANYQRLIRDGQFYRALLNTAEYTVIALMSIPVAVILAAMIGRSGRRKSSIYRALFFLPVVTSGAAIGLVWRFLYNGDSGIINSILRIFGIHGPYWLSEPGTALFAVGVVVVWANIGYSIVIFSAGLGSIPPDYYESAYLDGAGQVRAFVSITLPLLSPSIFFVSVLTVINTLQIFDLVYMMIPARSSTFSDTQSIVMLFYQTAFVNHEQGYAAAIAFVLFGIILVVTLLQMRLQKRWVHYA